MHQSHPLVQGASAWYLLARKARSSEPLVSASAGNFGQGLAYAAQECGQRIIIFAATTADPAKVARMRSLGAEVRLAGTDFDAAKEEALRFAEQHGFGLMVDGREPAIAEGAGTIALELCQWPQPIDAVIVPVGNGALINGIGRWMRKSVRLSGDRGLREGAPAMAQSWQSGRVCTTESAETAADTIAVRIPVQQAIEEMLTTVDEMVLVSEDSLREAVRLVHRELGLVVEPAGAASLAVAIQLASRHRGRLVAVVISGGNLAPSLFRDWLLFSQEGMVCR